MNAYLEIRWRLVYADGRVIDELPFGSTIKDRFPDPVELHLINPVGLAIWKTPIPASHKPIFYRVMGMDVKLGVAVMPQGEPKVDATIFGFGCDKGSTWDGVLWMWSDGKAVECPQEYIGQKAIELQLAV